MVVIHALAQIAPDRGFAVMFGGDAQIGGVIGLDAVEIILGLGIDHAEHRILVCVPLHMGDAIAVTGDRDALGLGFQPGVVGPGRVRRHQRQCGQKRSRSKQARGQISHKTLPFLWRNDAPLARRFQSLGPAGGWRDVR